MTDDVFNLAEEIAGIAEDVDAHDRALGNRLLEVASLLRARLPSSGDQVSLPASELAALREKAAAYDALEALVKRDGVHLDWCVNGDRGPPATLGVWMGEPRANWRPLGHGPTLASALSAAALAAKGAG